MGLLLVGAVAVGVGGLKAAAEAGISPMSIPITIDEMYIVLLGGGGLVVGGALLNVISGILANVVATTQEDVASENMDDGRVVTEQAPVSERHRRKLGRSYFYIGALVLLVVSVAARGDAIPGQAGSVAAAVAEIALIILFGSATVALVFAFFFFGLWYGIKRRSAEALLLGSLIAVLLILSAIQYRAAGLVLSGLWFLYYSFMSRKAVRFRLLEVSSVPVQIRQYVGQGDETGGDSSTSR
ncbi:hypothetical protein GCM10028857_08790 [Salinarchaeum chitinilyticum]